MLNEQSDKLKIHGHRRKSKHMLSQYISYEYQTNVYIFLKSVLRYNLLKYSNMFIIFLLLIQLNIAIVFT